LKRILYLLILLSIPAALFLSFPASSKIAPGDSHSIQIRGSETVMSLVQYGAEEYMVKNPTEIISVSGGDTTKGIKSLIDGTSQIAMASTEIDEELLLLANEKNITLVKHVVAYDAIVPFVNLDNPISDLSIIQLRKIFTSQITNWNQVGGEDAAITLTTRSLSSGTCEALKFLVLGQQEVMSPKAVPMESKPMKKFIIENPNGIGYNAFSYIDKTVKPLSVNGISASVESIKSGEYPLKRELILYTRDDASAEIIKFIEYIKDIVPKYSVKLGIFPTD
jgi:phosphate transport system substrate-binding protein